MGAESKAWVKVLITHSEWREVSAITLKEAEEEAIKERGVISILKSQWDAPND